MLEQPSFTSTGLRQKFMIHSYAIDERHECAHVNEKFTFQLHVRNEIFTPQRHVYQVNSHRRCSLDCE